MTKPRLTSLLLAALVACTAEGAHAQCAFQHPFKATAFRSSLVQAFLPCSLVLESCCGKANAETEGGIPSCYPAETFAELSGSQPGSWRWGPKGSGVATVAVKGSEVTLSVSLSGIVNHSVPATGTGHVSVLVRATLADPTSGTMTTVDLPIGFPLLMSGGKAKLKTALLANPMLQDLAGPCVSFELVGPPRVADPLSLTFATAGLYLR